MTGRRQGAVVASEPFCLLCGDVPSGARGRCPRCGARLFIDYVPDTQSDGDAERWPEQHDACIVCRESTRPHRGRGVCVACRRSDDEPVNRPCPWWSDDELAFVRQYAAGVTLGRLTTMLNQEFGRQRTVKAVQRRLRDEGIPYAVGLLSASQVARQLGSHYSAVCRWCSSGMLAAERQFGPNGNTYAISAESVLAFVRAHPMMFNPESMPRGAYRSAVEIEQRAAGWMSIEQVSAAIGYGEFRTRDTVRSEGMATITGRFGQGGRGRPFVWVRRSDVVAYLTRRDSAERRSA